MASAHKKSAVVKAVRVSQKLVSTMPVQSHLKTKREPLQQLFLRLPKGRYGFKTARGLLSVYLPLISVFTFMFKSSRIRNRKRRHPTEPLQSRPCDRAAPYWKPHSVSFAAPTVSNHCRKPTFSERSFPSQPSLSSKKFFRLRPRAISSA